MFTAPPEARSLSGFALMAVFVGVGKALAKKLSWRDAVASAAASAITGVVVGALCRELWGADRLYLTFALVGLASWMGDMLLDRLTAIGWGIVQAKLPAPPPSDPK